MKKYKIRTSLSGEEVTENFPTKENEGADGLTENLPNVSRMCANPFLTFLNKWSGGNASKFILQG